MNRTSLLPLLLLAIILLPTASAANIRPPATVIVDLIGYSDTGSGTWVARLNTTIQLSPDDNQTAPAFGYTMCGFVGGVDSLGVPYLCTSLNSSLKAIPSRPGWAWTGINGALDDCAIGDPCATGTYPSNQSHILVYNVTAWSGTTPSVSCNVTLDVTSVSQFTNDPSNVQGTENTANLDGPLLFPYGGNSQVSDGRLTYHACGAAANPDPVPGVNAIVNSGYGPNATDPSITNVSWIVSPSDVNQTVGNWSYYAFRSSSYPPNPALVYRGEIDTVNGTEAAGTRSLFYTSFDAQNVVNPLYVSVIGRDNVTHQQANFSCVVTVQQGRLNSEAACGNETLPIPLPIGQGAPAFPMLNITNWAPAVGLSVTNASIFLGAILVAIGVLGGWRLAGPPGAIVFGAATFAASIGLNLFPTWTIVLVFMLAITIGLLLWRGSSSGD